MLQVWLVCFIEYSQVGMQLHVAQYASRLHYNSNIFPHFTTAKRGFGTFEIALLTESNRFVHNLSPLMPRKWALNSIENCKTQCAQASVEGAFFA